MSQFPYRKLPYFYEGIVQSPVEYSDPSRDVQVTAELTSPGGSKRRVEAFWDGGRIWRFRVDADEPGVWGYEIHTSDGRGDEWLGHRAAFEVRPYAGPNPLYRHGPIVVSDNQTHLVHRDGTPFFWLADTTWNSLLKADLEEWETFLGLRREQGFTVMQCVMTNWRAFPADAAGERAYEQDRNIHINPRFFRRLDAKVEAVSRLGLVPALVVLWALTKWDPGNYLPEEDAVLLARYIVARYGAYRPVWFLGGDGRYMQDPERWRRIGRAVFDQAREERSLTTLHPCGSSWIGEVFRREDWYDFIGYQSSHSGDAAKSHGWIYDGEPATCWSHAPRLPVINLEPCYEAHKRGGTSGRFSAHEVRSACYYSLLASPTAGVTYGHGAVWPWSDQVESPMDHYGAGISLPWSDAVETPGTASMSCLSHIFGQIPWWKLRPDPDLVAEHPRAGDPLGYVAAARVEDGSLGMIYLPRGGRVRLNILSLKGVSKATWYDPRTGRSLTAAKPTGDREEYEAPDEDDWVLVFT